MTEYEHLPAWSLLTPQSVSALLERPSDSIPDVIRVATDLDESEVGETAFLSTTRLMIERAQQNEGLQLTASLALSRADTRALFDALTWPDYDKAIVLAVNKVLNEHDVMPVEIVRGIIQAAKFLRRRDRRLLATKLGTALLAPDRAADLFRMLFAFVFWRINLGYLDRMPVKRWPQDHIGLVLWCLSIVARDWSSADALMATCSVRDAAAIENDERPDNLTFVFEARILRPLTWFGLIETRRIGEPGSFAWRHHREFRKSALFDHALAFDVEIKKSIGFAH